MSLILRWRERARAKKKWLSGQRWGQAVRDCFGKC